MRLLGVVLARALPLWLIASISSTETSLAMWTSPERKAAVRVASCSLVLIRTFLIFGAPPQYCSLAAIVQSWSGSVHLSSLYGPVPFASLAKTGMPPAAHLGATIVIENPVIRSRSAGSGFAVLTLMVYLSTTSTAE